VYGLKNKKEEVPIQEPITSTNNQKEIFDPTNKNLKKKQK
jgi:hypothetical protein